MDLPPTGSLRSSPHADPASLGTPLEDCYPDRARPAALRTRNLVLPIRARTPSQHLRLDIAPTNEVDPMNEHVQVTGLKRGTTRYPRYDAAALGFEKYWYPVMTSRQLKEGKPRALTRFGERIMFYPDQGR